MNDYSTILEVDKTVLKGAEIVEPISLAMRDLNYGMQSVTFYTNMEMHGPYTILIRGLDILSLESLKVSVTYNENLNELPPGSYQLIRDAVVLAVKSYIYNNVYLEIGGPDLQLSDTVVNIISGYEGAQEELDKLLETKIAKLMFMSNRKSMTDYVTLLMR